MKRIQKNILMMDIEGKQFWKSMDAEECIACYHVKAYVDDGSARFARERGWELVPEEVAYHFFSRLEDAEAKVRMIMKSKHYDCGDGEEHPFGERRDGSPVLFEDLVEWGEACVMIECIRAMR